VATDKLRIRLDGTTGAAVTDLQGKVLDGDWTDTVSTYPSGDDVAGGDFAFRLNVLPVDTNGDGFISLNPDVQILLNQGGRHPVRWRTARPGGGDRRIVNTLRPFDHCVVTIRCSEIERDHRVH